MPELVERTGVEEAVRGGAGGLSRGLAADPTDDRFRNIAVAVYRKGLEQFPGDSHPINNLKDCEQEMKKGKK